MRKKGEFEEIPRGKPPIHWSEKCTEILVDSLKENGGTIRKALANIQNVTQLHFSDTYASKKAKENGLIFKPKRKLQKRKEDCQKKIKLEDWNIAGHYWNFTIQNFSFEPTNPAFH